MDMNEEYGLTPYETREMSAETYYPRATVAVAWEQNREKETTKMDDSEQKLGSRPLIARKRIVIAKRGAIRGLIQCGGAYVSRHGSLAVVPSERFTRIQTR